MKKEMTYSPTNCLATPVRSISVRKLFNSIAKSVESSAPIVKLARLYSILAEEEISPRRTLKIVHAQFAFFILMCGGASSLPVFLMLFAWALAALYGCRTAH